ncbi:hypothetical protein [Pseudoalteromonas 'SMAR']|uniref:hypothetical protein n=1 Tax=Pseudoalteromonas 'SMAR' TaxID=3416908 RepID=UPI003AF29CF1
MIEMLMDHKEWIFSGIGVVLLAWLAKLNVISLFYLESHTANNMNIDLRPRHKPFELWLDGLPKFKLWLRGANFNPFDITIKQITIEFNYGGVDVKCDNFIHRCIVPRLSFNDVILVEGNLTAEQADHIAGLENG